MFRYSSLITVPSSPEVLSVHSQSEKSIK